MSKLSIEGVTVDKTSIVGCDAETGNLDVLLEISARWDEKIADQMGWGPEGEGYTPPPKWNKGSIKDKLEGVNLILEPNKAELKDYRIDIVIGTVSGFKFTSDYDAETELASNRRIHCKIETHHEKAFVLVAELSEKMLPGSLTCSSTLTYNDPADPADDKQTVIPGTERLAKKRGRQPKETEETTDPVETVQ